MLKQRISSRRPGAGRSAQRGVVMMVAMVVLVIMTMAGLALMRSMDTTNMIAGNMAFKQASVQSADAGVEAAISWLELVGGTAALAMDLPPVGYKASATYSADTTPEAFWNNRVSGGICNLPMAGGVCASTAQPDSSGNQISFMIQRMCSGQGQVNDVKCAVVQHQVVSGGCGETGEGDIPCYSSDLMFRVTVRVNGPRNTTTYVQTFVTQPS